MANKQKSTETLATPPRTRTFMRAMATPRMLAAAVTNTDQNVQKSLATSDNHTFASLVFDPEALDSDAVKIVHQFHLILMLICRVLTQEQDIKST